MWTVSCVCTVYCVLCAVLCPTFVDVFLTQVFRVFITTFSLQICRALSQSCLRTCPSCGQVNIRLAQYCKIWKEITVNFLKESAGNSERTVLEWCGVCVCVCVCVVAGRGGRFRSFKRLELGTAAIFSVLKKCPSRVCLC
jgi:hypothetical protein